MLSSVRNLAINRHIINDIRNHSKEVGLLSQGYLNNNFLPITVSGVKRRTANSASGFVLSNHNAYRILI